MAGVTENLKCKTAKKLQYGSGYSHLPPKHGS